MKCLKSAATFFSKQKSIDLTSGLSNEILCIFVAQGLQNGGRSKLEKRKKFLRRRNCTPFYLANPVTPCARRDIFLISCRFAAPGYLRMFDGISFESTKIGAIDVCLVKSWAALLGILCWVKGILFI